MFEYTFSPTEIDLLQRYMLRRTVPLIERGPDGRPSLLGSSTLIEVGQRLFLITARHVLVGKEIGALAIPSNPFGGPLMPLGGGLRMWLNDDPAECDTDIGVLEILETSAAMRLRAEWATLPHTLISTPVRNLPFILFGYPQSLSSADSLRLHSEALMVCMPFLENTPVNATAPIVPGLDLFLDAASPEDLTGVAAALPRVQGTSGSSLWQFRPASATRPWAAENVLRVVGVISSAAPGQWVRAKAWWPVPEIFDGHEDQLPAADVRHLRDRVAALW